MWTRQRLDFGVEDRASSKLSHVRRCNAMQCEVAELFPSEVFTSTPTLISKQSTARKQLEKVGERGYWERNVPTVSLKAIRVGRSQV